MVDTKQLVAAVEATGASMQPLFAAFREHAHACSPHDAAAARYLINALREHAHLMLRLCDETERALAAREGAN